ncbi:MAG: DUF177 domain-containing protein [Prevotella sp.]|nr:DUF177 domain-containing protein [Prevotella sp.]
MCSLDALKIDLRALADDVTTLQVHLDDSFFEAVEALDIKHGEVDAVITVRKAGNAFELVIQTDGTVAVPCDLCLDDMEQPVHSETTQIVKLGEESSETDEVIVVDENEGMLNMAWIVYESIVLDIPIRHVHAPGKCNAAMTEKLNELSAARSSSANRETTVDPRWNALSNLKIED